MKHLPLAAISVLSALGLAMGSALAQDDAAAEPQLSTEQSDSLDTASTDAAIGESLDDWEHSKLEELGGETLFNDAGDSLGEIQEFVMSTEDSEIHAVISSEETLEVDDMTTVKLSDLRWDSEKENVVYAGDEAELDRMFAEQPYEEARFRPLDEAADQQAGVEIEEEEREDIAADDRV